MGTMSWNDYQNWATNGVLPTAMVPGYPLLYPALGLGGEAGEYLEKVKKSIRDGNLDREGAAKELGDVLWYLTISATHLGYTLQEIVEMNVEKLNGRMATNTVQGFGDNREEKS